MTDLPKGVETVREAFNDVMDYVVGNCAPEELADFADKLNTIKIALENSIHRSEAIAALEGMKICNKKRPWFYNSEREHDRIIDAAIKKLEEL